MITPAQVRRVRESLVETMELLEKWSNRKTFDKYQESEKQKRISEYKTHAIKLEKMLS